MKQHCDLQQYSFFRAFFSILFILGFTGFSSSGFSHHSTSEYDQTVIVEIEGEIAKVFWRNPHVMVHVKAMENGTEVEWLLEGSSVSALNRRGLNADLLQVGDPIRAAGYASTKRDHDMIVQSILLKTGEELSLRGGALNRWPNAKPFELEGGIDAGKAAAAEAEGIFRVWSWAHYTRGWWFFGDNDRFPLTASAIAEHANWDEFEDNPQLKCIAPGMPATMGNPYPIEFSKVGDNIELSAEEFDVVRTIHMQEKDQPVSVPANVESSHLGYSVGYWDDENTLVIATSKINWPYFNRVGIRQSDAVETLERFTIDEAQGHLNYHLKITDPATLTEPYEFQTRWQWVPGEEVAKYDCAVN